MVDVRFGKEGRLYTYVHTSRTLRMPHVENGVISNSLEVPGLAEKRPSVMVGQFRPSFYLNPCQVSCRIR